MSKGPGGGRGMHTVDKPKDIKASAKRFIKFLSKYKIIIAGVLILSLFSVAFNVIGPLVLAGATNELVNGVTIGSIDFAEISRILLMALGLYLISASFTFLQGFIMANVSSEISFNLRRDIMSKINNLPVSYFHKNSVGDILSRITNDVDTMTQNLSQTTTQIFSSLITLVGIIIMMLTISLELTAIMVIVVPLIAFSMMSILKVSQNFYKGQQEKLGDVNGRVEETYTGHLVVKAFGAEARVVEDFNTHNNKLFDNAWKAQFFSGVLQPIFNFISHLTYVAVCILGAILATGGAISIGGIQAFTQYVQNFTHPLMQVATVFGQFQTMLAASDRVFDFLEEAEQPDEIVKVNTQDIDFVGNVDFEDVSFGYDEKEILHGLNIHVKAGQKVAIVGPTGAGKSTMVNLLMRFYDIGKGKILLDNIDINDFARHDMRSLYAMVLQDTWLFSGTIMENIRYGLQDATDEQVISAAKDAHIHHFVKTLPDGYNTILDEDSSNVSQGQKQLITIARALLADAKIMILDEATSSVDTRTELQIQQAMDKLMRGRTSFVIAHRLSTIKNADLILVMKDGNVIETGNHDELMEQNGFYNELYNSQFAR